MDEASVTKLLGAVNRNEPGAEAVLFERVYHELRRMAHAQMNREQGAGSGDATGLVHDAYARLSGEAFQNRRHLFFAYARAMRQILVERARRKRMPANPLGAEPADRAAAAETEVSRESRLDAVNVSPMLERLHAVAPREHEVVMLKFFGGLSEAAIAEVLGVDPRTVRRDWAKARERLLDWTSGQEH